MTDQETGPKRELRKRPSRQEKRNAQSLENLVKLKQQAAQRWEEHFNANARASASELKDALDRARNHKLH